MRLRSVLIPALSVLLSACGGGGEAEPRYRVDSSSGVALVFREGGQGGLATMDAASAGGRFQLRGGCLVVEVGGSARTPIFPGPVRYDAAAGALFLGGRSYALGRALQLEFASASEAPELDDPLPADCPRQFFRFGGITERGRG